MSGQAVTPAQALAEKKDWAVALSGADLLPAAYRECPANLLLAAEYADTLGVPRMTALTGIHVIEGKPTMSADLMLALVRRAGHRLRVQGDDTHATATLLRADDPEFEYKASWDLAKAENAGLRGKGTWRKYPAALLRSRAITEVIRMGASEVLFGAVYALEELGAEVDAEGTPVVVAAADQAPEPAAEASEPSEPPAEAEPLATSEILAEISAHAATLHLPAQQLKATANYCGHPGGPMTLEMAEKVADYLKGRVEQAQAEGGTPPPAAAPAEYEDAQIMEEEPTL